MRNQRFACAHLSYSMALSHLLDTILPQLLTGAAHGGLKPSPTGRLRRVRLHLSYSMALSHLLDTTPPRSPRTGREPLSSSGSQHPAVPHVEAASARRALGWS